MLTSVKIQNYKSFLDAETPLSPFTLVIGPNGAGKSNFLQVLSEVFQTAAPSPQHNKALLAEKHLNATDKPQFVAVLSNKQRMSFRDGVLEGARINATVRKFSLDPSAIGKSEAIHPDAEVQVQGAGAVGVLDGLKTGDREDLFDQIEEHLIRFVPSIRKLSTKVVQKGQKQLQVSEHGIDTPFPVAMLSEGTKLILLFLTIVFQEKTPAIVLLEDIDRGLHPRLFQRVVEMLRTIVKEKQIQIVATTHNPYLIDEFVGEEDSVLIIEKTNAESKITSLADRLQGGETPEEALGALWFGGFVGGVPDTK
jgi:predicted ATPase